MGCETAVCRSCGLLAMGLPVVRSVGLRAADRADCGRAGSWRGRRLADKRLADRRLAARPLTDRRLAEAATCRADTWQADTGRAGRQTRQQAADGDASHAGTA
ncbi:hypothetical protein GCM10023097_19210 [Streptomyces collinus]